MKVELIEAGDQSPEAMEHMSVLPSVRCRIKPCKSFG